MLRNTLGFKTVSTQHMEEEEEYKSSESQSGEEPQANVSNEALGYWIKEDSKSISREMHYNITKRAGGSNIEKLLRRRRKKKRHSKTSQLRALQSGYKIHDQNSVWAYKHAGLADGERFRKGSGVAPESGAAFSSSKNILVRQRHALPTALPRPVT